MTKERENKLKRLFKILFSEDTESDRLALNALERMEDIKTSLNRINLKSNEVDSMMKELENRKIG